MGSGLTAPSSIKERKDVLMIQFKSDQGEISVSSAVFSNITGIAATNCFGVKGMAARSAIDGVYHLLRRESLSKGVRVEFHEDDTISIDLHIMVDNGVNLSAVGDAIISRVRYEVAKYTGTQVRSVNIFVDSMVVG